MADLNGKDYRACVRLSDPDDQTTADVGESCERVDPNSLGWLVAQGLIEPIATETVWADLGRADEPIVPTVAPADAATDTSGTETRGDA